MTVLITGGTGFTGAELARTLLKKGERPTGFDINPFWVFLSANKYGCFLIGTAQACRQHRRKTP